MHMHACLQAWPVSTCIGVATHAADPHKKKRAQQTSSTRPCSGRAASRQGREAAGTGVWPNPRRVSLQHTPKTQRTGAPHEHTANDDALKASILQPRQSHT